jgi:hypothetical protein
LTLPFSLNDNWVVCIYIPFGIFIYALVHLNFFTFQQGKDAILDALASLCSCCHAVITAEDSSLPSVILNAVCAACNKKSKVYREAAFLCLQKVFFFNPHLLIGPLPFC